MNVYVAPPFPHSTLTLIPDHLEWVLACHHHPSRREDIIWVEEEEDQEEEEEEEEERNLM